MERFFEREWTALEHWAAAGSLLLLWCVLGLLTARWVLSRLERISSRTGRGMDERIVAALHFPFRALVILSGAVVAARMTPLYAKDAALFALALKVVLLLGGILLADGVLQGLLKDMESRRVEVKNSHAILSVILRVAVWGIGSMMVLDAMGVPITPLLASLGVGSLAVALALQPALTNLFSGFYLLLDKPIRVGDFIKLDTGEEGYVDAVGWRTTRVRLLPNNVVVIPNSKLTESRILNYYLPDKECAVLVQVGVDYASDLARVERVTVEVARDVQKTVEGAVASFDPFIRYHTFADSSINFTVILRAQEFVANYLITHEFIKRLHAAYDREAITIPFPQRTLELREGPTLGAWTKSPPGWKT